MSSFNKSNDGQRTKSTGNFDSVPADDGFRNYMKRKIELQRKQFGLVIPPPTPSPPPPKPKHAGAPRILKKAKLKINNDDDGNTPSPQDTVSSNNTAAAASRSAKKSVRFHADVEVEGTTKTVSHVLANLKQRHSRKRASRSSSANKQRRRKSHGGESPPDDNIHAPSTSPSDSMSVGGETNETTYSYTSVLGVLDNLKKQSYTSLESPESVEEDNSVATSSTSANIDINGGVVDDHGTPSKRKRESPRCKGRSILEGLEYDSQPSIQTTTPASNVVETSTKSARKATNHRPDLFFTGVVVLVNGHTSPDATTLMRLLHKHGGNLEKYETQLVTHIIAEQLSAAKANIYKRQKNPTPVCRPQWITDSVEQGKLLPFGDYLLEDVRDEDTIGTKSVKSFFTSKPQHKNASLATTGNEEMIDESATAHADNPGEESNSHRWHDTLPSEANYHVNGQTRTVGNDPNFLESYFSNSRLSYIGSFKQRVKPSTTSASRPQSKVGTRKFVLLVDMDCFFASVVLRKYPKYKDKPVAVGHSHIARSNNINDNAATANTHSKNSSSELSTCNYVARKYGVRKGMFLGDAIQLCPDLVVLPYDFEGYEEVSGIVANQLHGYAEQYNGCVEQVSCDESYVEININAGNYPGNEVYDFLDTLAEHIRADIAKKTECTASIGIGPNKLLAKLAADRVKPNASSVVKDWREFLDERNLRDIPGIGRKFQNKLEPHGLCTVNDVWDLEDDAENVLGEIIGLGNARKVVQYCHGKDDRAVTPAVRKSIGAECNYGVRFDGPYGVEYMMQGLAKEVESRMTGAGVRGSKLVLKIMRSKDPSLMPGKFLGHGRCDSMSRSIGIALTRDKDVISSAAMKLYDRLGIDKNLVRGMGIVINQLKFDDEVDPLNSSPSKLSSWLKKDDTTLIKRNSQEAKIDNSFAIEENDACEATSPKESRSGFSTMPTFSQLDQDVLQNLPEDILCEVKSMYTKRSSQQSQNASQSPTKSSKQKIAVKGNNSEKPIPIAGQTSVRRMLKLACIKSGEEQLGNNDVSLSQLDSLPLEVQLQVANGDDVTIVKRPKPKTREHGSPRSLAAVQSSTIDDDDEIMAVQRPQIETNFHIENIAPLRDFISSNPNPDSDVVETVKEFLSLCVEEKRVDDAVTFLRTIKNVQDGWDGNIYAQLRDSTVDKIRSATGSMLDTRWLGL